MSIHDLKTRLSDVAGIETLTMNLEAGRIILRWGHGYSASVDAAASDGDIASAIRNATLLAPISLIPDKPAPTVAAPASPSSTQAQGATMSSPAAGVSAIDAMMAKHVETMGELLKAQQALLQMKLNRQAETVSKGFATFGDKIDGQTDDFEAMMSRYSNSFGA